MPRSQIDHITVTAPSLAAGAVFVQEVLGVAPQAGGGHPRMGTHNLLLRLGDALFLEVIAIDPQALAPGRPRWFGLDDLVPDALPALSTWVLRTPDIRASAAAATEPLGEIEPMSRGALDWLITIPADGAVPLDGVAPALIEWPAGVHPAAGLEEKGLQLVQLEIFHPAPARVERLLASLEVEGAFAVRALPPGCSGAAPYLRAHIQTPQGLRKLSSPL